MELRVWPDGTIQAVYGEAIPLQTLGRLTIRRASRVEPDDQGEWWADLSPVNGPALGPFARRSAALAAEQRWLIACWLSRLAATSD